MNCFGYGSDWIWLTYPDGSCCLVFLWNIQERGNSARCLLLPDGEALALDAWGHVAVETGDVRHLSPSTITAVTIVHLRADGLALIKGMREVNHSFRGTLCICDDETASYVLPEYSQRQAIYSAQAHTYKASFFIKCF